VRVSLQPSNGEAAGWQLLDARTGALIREGEWVREAVESDVELPRENGLYRVLVSTVDPLRGWAYERGESLRVVDVAVEDGVERVARERMTSLRALRLEGLPGRVGGFLLEPWRAAWENRALIATMVRRDVESRYRGSLGDRFWSIAQPLLLMTTYWFVFSTVLQSRLNDEQGSKWFLLYFVSGMLPWFAFNDSVSRAPYVILEHKNLVKKLVFPVEVLPINIVLSGLVAFVFALAVFLFFVMAVREGLPRGMIYIPALLIPQVLLTAGICWAWAALGVYVRDLGQVNGFFLTLVFFLTPICYPMDSLSPHMLAILQKAPMYKLVAQYRYVFVTLERPDLTIWLHSMVIGIVAFYAGYGVFRKLRGSFVDVL